MLNKYRLFEAKRKEKDINNNEIFPIYTNEETGRENAFDNSSYKQYNYKRIVDLNKEKTIMNPKTQKECRDSGLYIYPDVQTGKKLTIALLQVFILLLFMTTFSFADPVAGAPAAKQILFINAGAPFGFPEIIDELRNNASSCTTGTGPANTVTSVTSWPADLTTACGGGPCDQVWDYRYQDPTNFTLTVGQQTALQNYMISGGTVFILGENASNPKPGLDTFINSVIASGTYNASGVMSGGGGEFLQLNAAAATAAENFATDYLALASCAGGLVQTDFPGRVAVGQLATGHGVYENAAGTYATGVAFLGADLKAQYSSSKLFVWYDWQSMQNMTNCSCASYANMNIVKNIMDFLVPPTPTPTFTQTATPTLTPTATPTTPIVITKSISKTTVSLNDAVTYCFDFTNGSAATQNFVLWDTIPAVADYVGCDNSCSTTTISGNVIVYWNVSVNAGASRHMCFWVNAARFPWFDINKMNFAAYDNTNKMIPQDEMQAYVRKGMCYGEAGYLQIK